MTTTDLLSKPGMTGTDYRKARDGWIAAVLAHKGATGKRFNATAVRIAVALHQLSWTETTDNHRRGTFTGGAVMLAEHAGFAGIAERAQRNNAYAGTSALRDAGFLVLVSQGLGGAAVERSKAHNAVWALSLPSTRTPECGVHVDVNSAPGDLNVTTRTPECGVTRTPEYGVTHTPEYGDLPPGSPLANPLAISTSPTGRGYGVQTFQDEIKHPHPVPFYPQGLDDIRNAEHRCRSFIAEVTGTEPTDDKFEDLLDAFAEFADGGERKNWPRAFCGYLKPYLSRDVPHQHQRLAPIDSQVFESFWAGDGMFSTDTAPVPDETPAAPSSPAPVIDAEIVQDHTDEETTINPLSFRALFTADPRPGMARCLSALSMLQKAGITDEEIHRAHKAGRMDEHPNPDDCAERIVRDRDTITADCPF